MNDNGFKTFYAYEALAAKRRVKIHSGTTTTPPQVDYADAGEDFIGVTEFGVDADALVTVKLNSAPGTFECEATLSSTIARGTVLYGANDGKVSDASSGTAQGVALEAVSASGDIIEVAFWNVKATVDSTVSYTDTHSLTSAATVMAALDELYQNAISVQGFINIPLTSLREVSAGLAVGNTAANGGLLASDTTPILAPIGGSPVDGCQCLDWANSNNNVVLFQTALPPDLDDGADLVIHMRTKSGGTSNAVGFTSACYFNEADTAVADTSETNQTTSWAEKIITIAAADVPSGAQTLTCALTPVAHTTDHLYLSALWIEYKTKIKTS